MAIVSSEIIEDQVQIDGRRSVCEKHVDHTGKEFFCRYRAPSDLDVSKTMLGRVSEIEQYSVDRELRDILDMAEAGEDITDLKPEYTTKEDAINNLINNWFWNKQAWVAWNMVDLVDSLEDIYLTGTVGVSSKSVSDLRDRVTKLKTAKTSVESADSDATILDGIGSKAL